MLIIESIEECFQKKLENMLNEKRKKMVKIGKSEKILDLISKFSGILGKKRRIGMKASSYIYIYMLGS